MIHGQTPVAFLLVGIEGVSMLLWIEQSHLLIHGHGVLLPCTPPPLPTDTQNATPLPPKRAPVSIEGVSMLFWVEQGHLLIHGHGVLLTGQLPAEAVLLNPFNHVVPLAGNALPGLLGGTDQQQQLNLHRGRRTEGGEEVVVVESEMRQTARLLKAHVCVRLGRVVAAHSTMVYHLLAMRSHAFLGAPISSSSSSSWICTGIGGDGGRCWVSGVGNSQSA